MYTQGTPVEIHTPVTLQPDRPVLSPSSILPPPAADFAFVRARKNMERVKKKEVITIFFAFKSFVILKLHNLKTRETGSDYHKRPSGSKGFNSIVTSRRMLTSHKSRILRNKAVKKSKPLLCEICTTNIQTLISGQKLSVHSFSAAFDCWNSEFVSAIYKSVRLNGRKIDSSQAFAHIGPQKKQK